MNLYCRTTQRIFNQRCMSNFCKLQPSFCLFDGIGRVVWSYNTSSFVKFKIVLPFIQQNPQRRHPWQHLWKARNDACFCPFCLNLISFPTFFTLQDKHNIRTLSVNHVLSVIKKKHTLAHIPFSKTSKALHTCCHSTTNIHTKNGIYSN
jgi:hypothetical protein